MAQDRHGLSERRACEVVEQPRSTQRYEREVREDEDRLRKAIHAKARERPRYGSRRVTTFLREDGWRVNHKRVERIWREEGLKVPKKQRKRRRLGHSKNGIVHYQPEKPNHVWSYDFVSDQTEDGRTLKILVILDEFTRRCLALEVGRSFRSGDVIATLDRLVKEHGAPDHIRSDNVLSSESILFSRSSRDFPPYRSRRDRRCESLDPGAFHRWDEISADHSDTRSAYAVSTVLQTA
jgi:transposase InsO family protein